MLTDKTLQSIMRLQSGEFVEVMSRQTEHERFKMLSVLLWAKDIELIDYSRRLDDQTEGKTVES